MDQHDSDTALSLRIGERRCRASLGLTTSIHVLNYFPVSIPMRNPFPSSRCKGPGDDEERGDGRAGKKAKGSQSARGKQWEEGHELVDEAHQDRAWSSTQAFRDGECAVMRQP